MFRNLSRNLSYPDLACKLHFLKSDIDLTSIIIAAAAILVPPMTYLDYTYYGLGAEFYLTASLEGLFVIFSVLVILIIRHTNQVRIYEPLVFAWTMVISIAAMVATFQQPDRIIENVLISVLLLIAIYFLVANKSHFRVIPAVITTLGCIIALVATDTAASVQQDYLLILILVLLNAVGFVVTARNNRFKQIEFESQNREREARKMFENLASTDPLTGILNRRSFLDLAQQALDRFKLVNECFCLVLFDLDHLKQINDTHGHLAGDEAIRQFTSLVSSRKRGTDIFGRFGGDEFGFILPRASHAIALKVVARLRNALQEVVIPFTGGDFQITFSAGITEVRVEDLSPDDLIQRADQALYLSKDKGRDQIAGN
jgi:diguanylate cyclase (GGDEF)-like protein